MSPRSPAVILYDSSGNALDVDSLTKALVLISYEHHEVHEGKHFTTQNWQSVSGDGTELDLLLTVPADVYPHFLYELSSTAAFELELFESSTTSAAGTLEKTTNNNRNSANTNSMTVHRAPTVSGDGTSLLKGLITSGFRAGGSAGRENEIILKPSTKYLMRFTKTDAGEGRIDYKLNWYEKS